MSDLRAQLTAVYAKRGELTPENVLEEARDPDHPLHGRFTWDDTVAAEKWRRHEAHELIVSVKIRYADDETGLREVRAFHAVRTENGHVYRPADEIVKDDIATKVLLADMRREWVALQRRYSHFEEFASMIREDLGLDKAA